VRPDGGPGWSDRVLRAPRLREAHGHRVRRFERWVEVYPPEGTTGIALAPPPEGQDIAPTQTGIVLTTDDIDATHAAFGALGVDVDPQIARMGDPVPPMFWFRDPSGHTLMVVEQA
jgi:catechol 2,3-dioxygenase-like lactoylglutathione lyase family enzyme